MKTLFPIATAEQIERLAALLRPRFVSHAGCILVDGVADPAFLRAARRGSSRGWGLPDRTRFEATQNHLRILELFPHEPGIWRIHKPILRRRHPLYRAGTALGMLIAQSWLERLRASFPADRFRIYLTCTDQPALHLHRVYAGEEPWSSENARPDQSKRGRLTIFDTGAAESSGRPA